LIDHRQVRLADDFVKGAVGFRKEIAQLGLSIGCDPGEAVADSAGGAVMTLSKTSAQDQDFFHDDSLGKGN